MFLQISYLSIFKIYKEQTIEVGIYIDRHLYKLMEEVLELMTHITMMLQVLKTKDEAKVKEQLLTMVHRLFVQVLTICLHLEK